MASEREPSSPEDAPLLSLVILNVPSKVASTIASRPEPPLMDLMWTRSAFSSPTALAILSRASLAPSSRASAPAPSKESPMARVVNLVGATFKASPSVVSVERPWTTARTIVTKATFHLQRAQKQAHRPCSDDADGKLQVRTRGFSRAVASCLDHSMYERIFHLLLHALVSPC